MIALYCAVVRLMSCHVVCLFSFRDGPPSGDHSSPGHSTDNGIEPKNEPDTPPLSAESLSELDPTDAYAHAPSIAHCPAFAQTGPLFSYRNSAENQYRVIPEDVEYQMRPRASPLDFHHGQASPYSQMYNRGGSFYSTIKHLQGNTEILS